MNQQPETLRQAAAQYQVDLPDEQIEQLERFCTLLWQWNTRLNLTRHTDYHKFVTRDLADSRVLAEFLEPGEQVLDVGSGGGVPGVVLAILRPDLAITLSESVGKRARALADIVQRMHLRLPVEADRAENLLRTRCFNTLVVRAVARLRKLLTWFRPYWDRFDRLLVIKGPGWVEERSEARHYGLLKNLALRRMKSYPLWGTDSESVLLQICPPERIAQKNRCRLRKPHSA